MKIALCFSGQPRTWDKCNPTWQKLISKIKDKYDVETIDTFCHAWDFNTPPHAVLAADGAVSKHLVDDYITIKGTPLSEEERSAFLSALNPVRYMFHDETHSKDRPKELRKWAELQKERHGGTPLEWAASQFYAVMHSAHLKKQHEIENNFRYDICFRMRYDLFFDDHQIDWFLSDESKDLVYPEYNTFYSCHTGKDQNQYPFHRMGDIFWYADSVTFDRICDFYRWMPIIGRRSFNENHVSTEHALYFYAKMLRMNVRPISIDPKVYRQSDYIERKLAAGLDGGLGGHELI